MKWHNKFIPSLYVKSIKEIDYNFLKEQGIKALFFDLDNTLIPYDIDVIPIDIKEFLEELNKDFKIVVVSNSRKKRVSTASAILTNIPYVKFSRKPLKFGFKKALKLSGVKRNEVAAIGDQMMTDIYGANRMKFKMAILVHPIKQKSDHFLTRFNRKMENKIIKKIKKNNIDKYNEVLKAYAESK
ncbi:YqeG family HAD IIIA-type phosphatase [Haploplasma axanthum]|uniref:HAD phosphatase, family IIIA n=1 Tax=Haploplasma axanthum TaxID=29552 RepID=A0A449BDZ6_HAPAX|nr:YqeG family HAD IIIA-type phosphatase [Haploplasma axanthum]VEU80669.1 HAD phosphatase, family IIIA [Haploplasma axanthum]